MVTKCIVFTDFHAFSLSLKYVLVIIRGPLLIIGSDMGQNHWIEYQKRLFLKERRHATPNINYDSAQRH